MSRGRIASRSRIAGNGNEGLRKAKALPRIGSRKAVCGRDDITLSKPGKMPCYGWSMSAGVSCPASKLTLKMAEASGQVAVCENCYAQEGNYRFPNVALALRERMQFVMDSLKADNGETFVRAMVDMVSRAVAVTGPFFRVHDSGDFFHPMYVDCWRRIATALPDVMFWAPTREHLRPMMLPSLRALAALPNVSIRPSGPFIDGDAPMVDGLAAGSSVRSARTLPTIQASGAENVCPATVGEPSCDAHGCRKCWTEKSAPVCYALH